MAVTEFIKKLLQMLDENHSIMNWSKDGFEFQILDVEAFTATLLPNYFRHRKFESFVRQLNMYGFRKINKKKSEMIFQHQHFVREKPENYDQVKRRNKMEVPAQQELQTRIEMKEEVEHLKQTDMNFAELLNRLFNFKEKNHQINGKLKIQLEKLPKIVSTKKEKSVKLIVGEIKEHIRNISQAQKKLQNIIIKNINLKEGKKEEKQKNSETKYSDQIFINQGEKKFEFNSFASIRSFKSISNFLN